MIKIILLILLFGNFHTLSAEDLEMETQKNKPSNTHNEFGITPLMKSLMINKTYSIDPLIESEANINATDNAGTTALHIAARKGLSDVIEKLLEHKANPNIQDNNGWTPLMRAASMGHSECVKILLNNNADITPESLEHKNALQYAIQKENIATIKELAIFMHKFDTKSQEKIIKHASNSIKKQEILSIINDNLFKNTNDQFQNHVINNEEIKSLKQKDNEISQQYQKFLTKHYILNFGLFDNYTEATSHWSNIANKNLLTQLNNSIVKAQNNKYKLLAGAIHGKANAKTIYQMIKKENIEASLYKSNSIPKNMDIIEFTKIIQKKKQVIPRYKKQNIQKITEQQTKKYYLINIGLFNKKHQALSYYQTIKKIAPWSSIFQEEITEAIIDNIIHHKLQIGLIEDHKFAQQIKIMLEAILKTNIEIEEIDYPIYKMPIISYKNFLYNTSSLKHTFSSTQKDLNHQNPIKNHSQKNTSKIQAQEAIRIDNQKYKNDALDNEIVIKIIAYKNKYKAIIALSQIEKNHNILKWNIVTNKPTNKIYAYVTVNDIKIAENICDTYYTASTCHILQTKNEKNTAYNQSN